MFLSADCFSSHIILPLMSWVNEILVPSGYILKEFLCDLSCNGNSSKSYYSVTIRDYPCILDCPSFPNGVIFSGYQQSITVLTEFTMTSLDFQSYHNTVWRKQGRSNSASTFSWLSAGYVENNSVGQLPEQYCVMCYVSTYLLILGQRFSKQY